MSSNRFNTNQWLSRILLIAIIAFSAAVMYAVNQIDYIVNNQLYEYQLQPSPNWLDPYHNFANIIYVSLGATMAISAIVLLLGFIKSKEPASAPTMMNLKTEKPSIKVTPPVKKEPQVTIIKPKTEPTQPTPKIEPAKQAEPKTQPEPAPQIATKQSKAQSATVETVTPPEEKKTNKQNDEQTKACPACKKTFSQPLVMLDFEGGKSKLVNVCPYCNQVLGDTEQKSQ